MTDLCLAVRSDPVGMIRGLWEVVTCVYRLAVVAYRHSVVHVSLISILDGTAQLVQTGRLESADE